MTITINEAGLALDFPKGWLAVKYDAQQDGAHHSTFFERNIKNNFSRKAIDVVAVCPSNTLVFIEVKGLSNKRDFIEKYHDSTAGLFFSWMARDEAISPLCDRVFCQNNSMSKKPMHAVLLVKDGNTNETRNNQKKAANNELAGQMRKQLRPLGFTSIKVRYLSDGNKPDYGWKIKKI